ncbi:MFS transporter [Lactiplantibacillus fabifermentans]|uniref:Major facilitator superfamily permease n=2 Tax=Lactiplantibacillus fabifermentans TaxID=483011 RepID=A0A0R2NSN7_9LACO|nr:MFS transporter [Lactiplantibacillus fabifermentans]ETY74426.1 MFS transporter [Lactiplantibacillus fabifermentans T30PCM01]KRO28687.1 major facilitator superfamily permease [Lactiplantibacillus fabifermentans DSM 21115]
MNKIIFRNLRLGYTYTGLAFFGITSLWVIFLQQQGLSLVEIGLCESIFHLTSFLSEVPSGILADRFSYKTVLIGGRIAAILHATIMLTAHSFWWFALGFVLQAWAYNLQSGTIEALLYESLAEGHATAQYPQVTKTMNTTIEFADTLGVLIAGWLIHGYLKFSYWGYIIAAIIAIISVVSLHEPRRAPATTAQQSSVWQIVKAAGHWLKKLPQLRNLMVFHATFTAIGTTYYYYFQAVMTAHGFSGPLISGILVATAILNIAGVQLTPWLQQKWPQLALLRGLSILLTIILVTALWSTLPELVMGYLLINMLMAIVEPLLSNYYNALIPSAQRATLLSVASMLFSVVMIIVFPIVGWLIQISNFTMTFGWLGLLLGLLGGRVLRHK